MFINRSIYFLFIFLVITSCNKIEYSPNQVFNKKSPVDLNKRNLEKIAERQQNSNDDTIRFILSGDTQRAYNQSVDLVRIINQHHQNLDFLILNGDISDFGLLQEMVWIASIFDGLKIPYIGVIGNHDLVANGKRIYERMFGELNFSFIYKSVKFICHDTNSREYKFNGTVPNIPWLQSELQTGDNVKGIISISHIPPRSEDFDANLRTDYEDLLNNNPKMLASLHAHENIGEAFYTHPKGIPFIVTNAVQNREFLYVEVFKDKLIRHEYIQY